MNNDQNSQFENGTGDPLNTEMTYSYTFSQGDGTDPSAPPPRKRKRVGLRVTAIVLTLTLCFGLMLFASLGGALLLAGVILQNADPKAGGTEQEVPPTDLLHDDPSSILEKSESDASIYGSAGEEAFAASGVVRKVEQAVVVINTSYPSSMGYNSTGSTGSGVIISDTGYILTCNHVVEDAAAIQVTLNSGSVYTAALVGADASSDLAVIKITPREEEPLTYVEQGCSSDLVVGENVVAIGNPLGMGLTATTGIVSATERNITMSDGTQMTLIQTDAAINSGNSGGGLFNLDGQLIGIVNAKYSASGVEGLAFAIPIDSAYEVETQLIQYGYVRGVIDHGLTLLEVTSTNLRQAFAWYGISTVGLYVFDSEYSADFQQLDRIDYIGDCKITTASDLKEALASHSVGDTVTVKVTRNGKSVTVELTLREYVPDRLKTDQE